MHFGRRPFAGREETVVRAESLPLGRGFATKPVFYAGGRKSASNDRAGMLPAFRRSRFQLVATLP